MKMKVPLKQLRVIEQEKPKASKVMRSTAAAKTVPMEVDVRGMNLEEATEAVDTYLADAVMAGLNEVSIIHGKGTGVLRAAVHDELRRCKYVKSFRLGVYGEGESGVTIVEFK